MKSKNEQNLPKNGMNNHISFVVSSILMLIQELSKTSFGLVVQESEDAYYLKLRQPSRLLFGGPGVEPC